MAAEIGPVLSFLLQRIVPTPFQVEAPRPTARSTPLKRFREGLSTETTFRAEMAWLGWSAPDIERSLIQARLEREFDDFQDRLNTLEEAYNKDFITFAEMKLQVLTLIPDQAKALLVVDLLDFKKRPKPKPLTPPEVPTLTVGKLLSAFAALVLPEAELRAELARRLFSPEDIDLLVATEIANLPKPKPAERAKLTLADLRALLALGILTPEEFLTELIARKYSQQDAEALMALEMSKALARAELPLVPASITLEVLEAEGVEKVITLELPSEISLAVLEAEVLPSVPPILPIEVSLALLEASVIPPIVPPPVEAVSVFLSIVEAAILPSPPPVESAEVSLWFLELEEV